MQHDPSVLAVEGACVRLVLRDGRTVFGTITRPRRPAGEVVALRPWGVVREHALAVADIRRAGLAQVCWEDVRKITSEQAHTWGSA
jgi:hypothetical protein